MHKLRVENFQLMLKIGVSAVERKAPQKLYLSLEASSDASSSAAENTDNIADVMIDYDSLLQEIRAVEGKEYNLIESLASDIHHITCNRIKDKSLIITVEIKKYPDIEGLIGGVNYCIKR